MKITKIHLTNFKRFSDLLIDNIPATSKLVLLIGSNGSGKSSLFDAFGLVNNAIKKDIEYSEGYKNYFKKNDNLATATLKFDNGDTLNTTSANYENSFLGSSPYFENLFYGRTSFRQIPRLTRTALGQNSFDSRKDADRPFFFIDRDNRFENDLEKIIEFILNEIFVEHRSDEQIRKKYIDPINLALKNIFGKSNGTKLQLLKLVPPLEGKVAQITFEKGSSEFHYNYLSAGEKEVFNLLINFLSRSNLYQDSIYYLDEIDLHLNTKIQFNLLKELTENWIPENCQLWTASHSLGFIEYAKQSEIASIIDFDDLDFDLPRVLTPVAKENPDIYEIAVGKEFLPSLFQHMKICFVENLDMRYYASIGIPNTIFVLDNNRDSVYHKVRTTEYHGIIDRDFLSDDDIVQIKKHYPNLCILGYYSIENYLYHPDNLNEYNKSKKLKFNREEYVSELTIAKNQEKSNFLPTIKSDRNSYPFFGESKYDGNTLQKRFKNRAENNEQSITISEYIQSDVFETYYRSLPMKSYCTQIPQRQNISKIELAQTKWFKRQIEEIIS